MKRIALVKWWVMGVLFASQLSAGLVWENQHVEHQAQLGEEYVVAVFTFFNEGEKPVQIQRLHSTCGCTVAELNQREYAPGERGEISAVFHYGERTGMHEKEIFVYSDDRQAPTVLKITADIPVRINFDKRMLYWQVGGESQPQRITIQINPDLPMEIVRVESTSEVFAVELKRGETKGLFYLEAKPANLSQRHTARVVVYTNYPEAQPAFYQLFLGIR